MQIVSFRLFLFLLTFAPLAFGTSEHWSLMTVQLVAPLAFLLYIFGQKRAKQPLYSVPGAVPFLLLLGFMCFQLIPLPPPLLKVLSPASWEVYKTVQEISGTDAWVPISVNQKATLQELLRFTCYGLFYVLTIQLLSNKKRVRYTLHFVAVLSAAIALLAILQQFSSEGAIYWFRNVSSKNPGGPWVNINQYAAFIASLCPIILSLFLYYKPQKELGASLRQQTVSLFSAPDSNRHILFGVAFILLLVSIVISLCRGGIVVISGAMIFYVLVLSYKRRSYAKMPLWIALAGAILAITWIGWQPVIDELDRSFTPDGTINDVRFQLWADTSNIVKEYLFTGGGFGTFIDVYPSFKTISDNLVYDHTHNEYLEILTDGGIIGFLLAGWFCMSVLFFGFQKIKVRRDGFAVLVGLGTATGILSLLAHCVVDFHLHNGAIGLYFFFLCGLFVTVTSNRNSFHGASSLLRILKDRSISLLIFLGVLTFFTTCTIQISLCIAAYNLMESRKNYLTSHLASDRVQLMQERLQRGQVLDPLDGVYPFELGNIAVFEEGRAKALEYYLAAATKQPLDGVYLQRVALMIPVQEVDRAARLMKEGYEKALNKEQYVVSYVEWLLVNGKRNEAITLMGHRLSRAPNQFRQFVPLLDLHQFSRLELDLIMPDRVGPWIYYGHYLEKRGKVEQSQYYRVKALDFIKDETTVKATWFNQLIRFYLRYNKPEKAIEVVRRGINKLPDYAPFHVQLGDYYLKQGISYRAKEEYQRAVMLEPNNKNYLKKLRKIELDEEFGEL